MEDYEYEFDYDELFTINPFAAREDVNQADTIETVQILYETCVFPSVASIVPIICYLLMFNMLFNMTTQAEIIPKNFSHGISSFLGILLLLKVNCPVKLSIFIFFLLSSYGLIWSSRKMCKKYEFSSTIFTSAVLIVSLLICEFGFPYPHVWLEIRGVIMVLVMKAISVAHDFERSPTIPTFYEYLGYMCCPANCLFGPWCPFNEYCATLKKPSHRNRWWLHRIVITLLAALIFLSISNCWSEYFISENYRLLKSYKLALAFRTSHYFVSYLSEMGMIAAGFRDDRTQADVWKYEIVNPFKVEFPTSLVSVVTNWNIPMHVFLKKYIYRKVLPHGEFIAILATYLISALLHGFNTEIAVVLLTIGLFSYAQLKFQQRLSVDLHACVQIRPCKQQCHHKYKKGSQVVVILTVVFSLLTVVHLAYLGMLMDAINNSDSPSISHKWEELQYFSHFFLLFCYLYYLS